MAGIGFFPSNFPIKNKQSQKTSTYPRGFWFLKRENKPDLGNQTKKESLFSVEASGAPRRALSGEEQGCWCSPVLAVSHLKACDIFRL